jgi:hypothetical protein
MWDDLFLPHPRTVNESYFEHAGFAGRFAATLFLAALCALVHAVFPAIFDKTASKMVAKLYAQTSGRGRNVSLCGLYRRAAFFWLILLQTRSIR